MIAVAVVATGLAAYAPAGRIVRRSQYCWREASRHAESAGFLADAAVKPPIPPRGYACGNTAGPAQLKAQAEDAARLSRAYRRAAFRFWESPSSDPVIAREEEWKRESPLYQMFVELSRLPASQRTLMPRPRR